MTPTLLPCPFCNGVAGWCDEQPPVEGDDPHECHQIICTQCHLNIDMAAAGDPHNEAEELADLKAKCAEAWNRRVL